MCAFGASWGSAARPGGILAMVKRLCGGDMKALDLIDQATVKPNHLHMRCALCVFSAGAPPVVESDSPPCGRGEVLLGLLGCELVGRP